MHRFYISSDCLAGPAIGDTVLLPDGVSHQTRNVLRLRLGSRVAIFNGDGGEWLAEVVEASKSSDTATRSKGMTVRLLERSYPDVELSVNVTMVMALTRAERYETALAKCTELGAARFIPVVSDRVQARDAHTSEHRMSRWRRIVTESSELSGRVRVPNITAPVSLLVALNRLRDSNTPTLFLWEETKEPMLWRELKSLQSGGASIDSIALVIGPVGGFSESEALAAEELGATCASLGRLTLRTETAAITAMSLVSQLWN